ncbi:hypothetical protein H0X32_01245 [Patescibacteria group bacterium]|nr:hypothetical protein [Patescibacteria group bacterium]
MYVLDIIPLSPTAPSVPLSYRSRTKFPAGTLINVPLRKKIVPGLVIGSIPVHEAKSALKAATFSLSKSSPEELGKLPPAYLAAAQDIATYHATTLGAVLSSLLVPVLTEEMLFQFSKKRTSSSTPNPRNTIERIEAPLLSRRAVYEKYVEKKSSKNGTTLLVVPTLVEMNEWAILLKKYAPLLISGKLSGKRREEAITRACGARDRLVIVTPAFSWIPIPQLERIIIDRVSAGSYTFPKRPYIDLCHALAALAFARNIPLVYGDYPLPLEYRIDPIKPLVEKAGTIEIRDVRTDTGDRKNESKKSHGPWKAIPDDVRKDIKSTLTKEGRVVVLAVRHGYSPTVVCRDCGTTVTDEYGRILSFVIEGTKRLFRSVDGATIEAAHTRCKVCDSWNLLPLGVGVDRVEEELRMAFPDSPLVSLTQEALSKASFKKVRTSLDVPGTIVVGTEGMLPWLSPEMPFDLGVIASADSLLALPFWRARERFVRIGLMLAERATRTIVATRHPEDAALLALISPTTTGFWKEETEMRKILHYPPFGTLIVFQVEATATQLTHARAVIRDACEAFLPIELPPRQISPTIWRGVSVLQLQGGMWPDVKLSERLSRLPPSIRVHIDSETLW